MKGKKVIDMTAYKLHGYSKKYISLYTKDYVGHKFNVTNGVKLLREAYQQRQIYKETYGFEASSFVINNTVFIDISKLYINKGTKHIKFNGGFLPLSRINRVDIV